MSLERVDPDTLYPAHGFAHAVVASGSRTIYVGGQVASNLTGGEYTVDGGRTAAPAGVSGGTTQ